MLSTHTQNQQNNSESIKEYANINFKFIKAYQDSGTDIINSMYSRHYEVSRPDSIRFSHDSKLVNLLHKYALYQLPRNYSPDSGKYEIEAKHAAAFLDGIISLKKEQNAPIVLGQTEVHHFLDSLKKHDYLSEEQYQHYLQAIPVDLTLEERRRLAEKNNDFKEALAIAHFYRDKKGDTQSAMNWLEKAIRYKPVDMAIEELVNLDEFLSSFSHLDYPNCFSKHSSHLLDALKRNNTITEINFNSDDSDVSYVNKYLADFIAESKTIKSLDIATGFWQQERLIDTHMDFIGYGLRYNTSLEDLNLAGHHIGDEGLTTLLESLRANPQTKLRNLNVYAAGITEIGAKALIEFLQTNKTLESINLNSNGKIPKALIEEINTLLKQNKTNVSVNCDNKPLEQTTIIPKPKDSSPHLRHSFLANLGKRLNVGNILKSWDVDWFQKCAEVMKPYAEIKFLIPDVRFDHMVNFIVVLEHCKPLNIEASYKDGLFFNTHGSGIITSSDHVHFSVRGPSYQTYYLNKDASVFEICIEDLRVSNEKELDKKMLEGFEAIESTMKEMFTKGIYRMDREQRCVSWLENKESLVEKMVELAEWYHADSYSYDKSCFPKQEQSNTFKK